MSENIKVLVIEDDLHARQILHRILTHESSLRRMSIRVFQAADGEEGIALFREHKPDLVITDLLMPKKDGFQVIEEIRAAGQNNDCPILVTSGVYRDKRTVANLEQIPGVAVQLKPYRPQVIAKTIKDILQRTKSLEDVDPARPAQKEAAQAPPGPQPRTHAQRTEIIQPPTPVGVAQPKEPAEPAQPNAGNLAEVALPRLLLEILDRQLSGALDLRRGKVRKIVYLLSGHPIFVQSNQRSETLGQMLVRRGRLTPQQNSQALALVDQQGIKYGEAVVRLGLFTEGQVMDELLDQTRLKLEACLRWEDGAWIFVEDTDVGNKVPRCIVDPVSVVFNGLRAQSTSEDAFSRVAQLSNQMLKLTPLFESHREKFESLFGRALLDAIAPGLTVGQVIQASGAVQETVLQIDILLRAGLVETEDSTQPPAPVSEAELSAGEIELEESAGAEPSAGEIELEEPEQPEEPAAAGAGPAIDLEELAAAGAGPAVPLEELAATGVGSEIETMPWEREAPPEAWDESSAVVMLSDYQRPKSESQETRVALQLIQSTYLSLHDSNHYEVLGVTPESDIDSIEVAYNIKRMQFDLGKFKDMDLGQHYAHLEEICASLDRAWGVLSDPLQREAYDLILEKAAVADLQKTALGAEDLCRQGEEQFNRKQYAEAVESFRRAAERDAQSDYLAKQALALFLSQREATGDLDQAAAFALDLVEQALASDPDETTGLIVAAAIHRDLNHPGEALRYLRQAIKLDPMSKEAFGEIESILLASEDPDDLKDLERQYRQTIHLLGDKDRAWATDLWRRLSLLYHRRIREPDKFRTACEIALRLNPTDRELRQLLAELDQDSPDRWPQAVLGYRALLRGEPDQIEPVHSLFRIHFEGGRGDAAVVAASVAVLRHRADEDERQAWEAKRPRALKRATRPLDASMLEALRHADDDTNLGQLFQILTPLVEELHPLQIGDLGLTPRNIQADASQPDAFESTLSYVAEQLGMEAPAVALREGGAELVVQEAATNPPLLVVSPGVLQMDNQIQLCFRLGRALSLLGPGRKLIAGRPRRILRDFIVAALKLIEPSMALPDPEGSLAAIGEALKAHGDLIESVRACFIGLQQRFRSLDLGAWQRGVCRTADRIGLLLSADLVEAGQILVAQDVEAERDLIDFALSESYGDLRQRLGLAIEI